MTGVQARAATGTLHDDVVRVLAERFRGELIRPGDMGYDEARTIFNAMIDCRPALIARCAGTEDVVAAVNVAREHDLLVSIRGGGHNVAGNAMNDGGIVIDLSAMREVVVDPDARTAQAQGGVQWGEFDRATQEHGLATTGGVVPTTGIAGLTLGGGLGFLSRRFGLACDNLIEVEVVTADGRVRTANEHEHADLFWAVRGGGGNFGVVTSLTYRLHPVGPTVVGGMTIYPLDRAGEVLRFYREYAPSAPDEMNVIAGMLTGPDGERAIALVVCYSGPLDDAERMLAPIRDFGQPVADLIGPLPYVSMQELFAEAYPQGRRNYWKSSFMDDISDPAIDTVVAWFETSPSPWSTAAFELLGGATGRIDPDATAFSQRGAIFNFTVASGWSDPAEDELHMQWSRDYWQAMQPFMRSAAYVNYLQADEGERIRAAYGDSYERMVALKAKYDPHNLFRMNQNIKPRS